MKTVVITGGTDGISRALALTCVVQGARGPSRYRGALRLALGLAEGTAVATGDRSGHIPSTISIRNGKMKSMSKLATKPFTHHVVGPGPAHGMRFTGRERISAAAGTDVDPPLVVALHGGGYTSAYFDLPGYSLLDRGGQMDLPIIAVDRPGYGGSSPVPGHGSFIFRNAEVLDQLVGELWAAKRSETAGVVLVGHSIGAAVALTIASRQPTWPLLGVAVSGFTLTSPPGQHAAFAALPDPIPPEAKAESMFGPEWTRPPGMPQAAYGANAPLVKDELLEIPSTWADAARDVLATVSVPVQLRQGEFDTAFVSDESHIAEFADALPASPWVDARLALGAGHAIDYHLGGTAFQLEQLAFALNCCVLIRRNSAGTVV